MSSSLAKWKPYRRKLCKSEDEYTSNQERIKASMDHHHKFSDDTKWFREQEEAAMDLLEGIMDPYIQFITLCAEPGSGKTAVIHRTVYDLRMLPYLKKVNKKCITLTTGMSDLNWLAQIQASLKLEQGDMINTEWSDLKTNHSITHRSTFRHRVKWLLTNTEYLSNHVFIIDESHFADDKEKTMDTQISRLGLTHERMKEYNITIILVSATPDVSLFLLSEEDHHKLVRLEPGRGYKGFKHYHDKKMIENYDPHMSIGDKIRSTYTEPRWHYMRMRKANKRTTDDIQETVDENGWNIIHDDCKHRYWLSFEKGNEHEEQTQQNNEKIVIRLYDAPQAHTIILLKGKYSASFRMKLGRYTGLVMERSAGKTDTSVTCNGLIPRFMSYVPDLDQPDDEKPVFICDYTAVRQYLEFSKDFIYKGIDYNSRRLTCSHKRAVSTRTTTAYADPQTVVSVEHETNPILKADVNDQNKAFWDNKNHAEAMKFLQGCVPGMEVYHTHKLRLWRITESNRAKWGIVKMHETGARSSSTNVQAEDRKTNIVFAYLDGDTVLISAWSGARTPT